MRNFLILTCMLLFNMLFAQAPVNDNPANATVLDVNPTLTVVKSKNGTNVLATESGISSSCDPVYGNDVFYSFTAQSKQQVVQFSNYKVLKFNNINSGLKIVMYDNQFQTLKCAPVVGFDSLTYLEKLTIGSKYYIRVANDNDISFTISVNTPPSPPINDECSNAINIVPSNGWDCTNPKAGNVNWATTSNSIFPESFYDVWYTFTATSSKHTLYLEDIVGVYSNNTLGLRLAITKNPCNPDTLLFNSYIANDSKYSLSGLVVGQKYYVQISAPDLASFAFFNLCITTPPVPIFNESCETAELLQVNPTEVISTTKEGATAYPQFNIATTTIYPAEKSVPDVWYKFVATSTKHLIALDYIQNFTSNSVGSLYFNVFEGNTCNSSTQLNPLFSTGTHQAFATQVGKTYMIKTINDNPLNRVKYNISISTIQGPVNDECTNALNLEVNTGMSVEKSKPISLHWAADDLGNLFNGNVWVSFTATKKMHFLWLKNASANQVVKSLVNLYSGDCNSLVFDRKIVIAFDTITNLNNLIIGKKYYMSITKETFGEEYFNIGILTPPIILANDDSNDAILLSPDASGSFLVNYNLNGATKSPETSCFSAKDIWYKFIAQKELYSIKIDTVSTTTSLYIYEKSANNQLVLKQVLCNEYAQSGLKQFWIDKLEIGKMYWVAVGASENRNNSLGIISFQNSPINDEVANSILINNVSNINCTNPILGNFKEVTPSKHTNFDFICSNTLVLGDVWYKFIATNTNHYVRVNIPQSPNASIRLHFYEYDNTTGQYNTIYCSNSKYLTSNLFEIGKTYYINVSANVDIFQSVNFEICVGIPQNFQAPPINDECEQAINLTVQNVNVCDSTIYTTAFATTQPFVPSCGFERRDVWFKFTAFDTIYKFWLFDSNKFPHVQNSTLTFTIYKADDCNSISYNSNCQYPNEILSGFEIGKTYYLRVFGEDISQGIFQEMHHFICCVQKVNVQVPVNDICQGAKNIPINPNMDSKIFLSETNAFAHINPSPKTQNLCIGDANKFQDMWYKFTATKPNHYIQLFDKKLGDGLLFDVYKGDCTNGFTSLYCDSTNVYNEDAELNGLNVGETYFIRVFTNHNSPYSPYTYKIGVCEIPNVSISNCSTAENIVNNKTYECYLYNSPKKLPIKGYSNVVASQKWYKIKATDFGFNFNVLNYSQYSMDGNLEISVVKAPCADSNMIEVTRISPSFAAQSKIDNLQKDSTYYIVFYSRIKSNLAIKFSIEQPDNKLNYSCSTPMILQVNPSVVPINPIKDSLDSRFDKYKASFYQFVATSKHHIIYLKTLTKSKLNQVGVGEVFDNCISSKETALSNIGGYYSMPYLTPGNVYMFYTSNFTEEDLKTYEIEILTAPQSPANDFIGNAISLDPVIAQSEQCTSSMPIQLKNATIDTTHTFYSYEHPVYTYQWYTFTATNKTHIFNFRNYTESGEFLAQYLFQFLLKDIGVDKYLDFSNSNKYDLEFNNLVVGNKYTIGLSRGGLFNTVNFDLCITIPPVPPINDECVNAQSIVPNTGMIPTNTSNGSLLNSTASQPFSTTCYGFQKGDVWYKFVATSKKHFVYLEKPADSDFYVSAIHNCDFQASLACSSDTLTFLDDLVIGQQYSIAVHSATLNPLKGLSFKIGILTPTVNSFNDDCTKAINVPVSSTTQVQQYVQSYFNFQKTLWFKFTATSKSHRIKMVSSSQNVTIFTTLNTDVNLGENCISPIDSNALLNIVNGHLFHPFDSTSLKNVVGGLEIGKTYFVKLANNSVQSTQNFPFKIGIASETTPPNRTKFTAKLIPVNPGKVFTNSLAENVKNLSGDEEFVGLSIGSLWYEFVATSKRHKIMLSNLTTNMGFLPYANYKIYEVQNQFTGENFVSGVLPNLIDDNGVLEDLTIGKKYSIQLFLKKYEQSFSGVLVKDVDMIYNIGIITFGDKPVNDECSGAQVIPVNSSYQCQQVVHGSTQYATNLFTSNADDDDVWYKFTAKSDLQFIQLKNIVPVAGYDNQMEFEVYEAGAGGSCNFTALVGNLTNHKYSFAPWKLVAGQTYYLKVYTKYYGTFSRCEFDLCISTPIANDEVSGALLVSNFSSGSTTANKSIFACSNPVTASSVGATYSFNAEIPIGNCKNQGVLPKDIWFKTVVGTKKNLAINVMSFPQGADVQIVAYKLKNGKLNLLSSSCKIDTLLNLTTNDTIALRVWDGNGIAFGDYTLCIESFEKNTNVDNITVCTNVKIHPVPTSDYLNVKINYITSPKITINVSNLSTNQIIKHEEIDRLNVVNDVFVLDVRNYMSGTYLLTIFDGKNTYSKTFIKI